MHSLVRSVLRFVRKENLLRAGDRVAVAISGGADSVALTRILLELRSELGVVLSLVHLNHQLRGAEADEDQRFVVSLAAEHELKLVSESRDVSSYAAARKISLETAARELRYAFFQDPLRDGRLDKIATAHTLDDQAETVLLKLVRGAGTRGLSGIYPRLVLNVGSADGGEKTIVRPLLGTRRDDLIGYLKEIGQNWREDSSNRDLRHARNRVRHRILTRLAEELNPQVRETLCSTAEIARSEEDFWRQEIGRLLPEVWQAGARGGGMLNMRRIEEPPLAIRRRLVRAAGESLGINLEFRHVEEVLSLHGEGERVALPAGWVAVWHKHELRFTQEQEQANDYEYELPVPGRIAVPEAAVVVEALEIRQRKTQDRYDAQHLLDPSLAGRGLRIRNWRPGDRFWPAHTKEPKKIKELLQERQIAGHEKKLWTVVASGEQIVWVRGFGVRRDYQAPGGEGVLIRDCPLGLMGMDLDTF